MNNKTSQGKGVVPPAGGADGNEPNAARPEGVQTSVKRGPGRPRKQKSKDNNVAPDQGNLSYDSDAERVAEAISRSLMDAPTGKAAAPRTRLDFSSLRSGGSNKVRITRSQSEERERCAQSDDFRVSAQDATAEAEAPQREAQRPGRIEFNDDVNDSAPGDNGLAAAETQIQEQVNMRVAEARALRARELTRKLQEEERRRHAAAVEAEVERRVQQLLLADEAVFSNNVAPSTPYAWLGKIKF